MVKLEYKGVITNLKGMKDAQKLEGVKSSSMKKDYGFTLNQIREFEENGKLNPYFVGKSKYYKRDEIMKLL